MRTTMLEKIAAINKSNGFLQESKVVENVLKQDVTIKEAKGFVKKVCDECDDETCPECKCACELILALLDCCGKDEDVISSPVKSKLSALLICADVDVEKVKTEAVIETRTNNNKYFGEWQARLNKYN